MRKADNLPPSCAVVTKSGNLNFLEPSGTLQARNGTALPFFLLTVVSCLYCKTGIIFPCIGSSEITLVASLVKLLQLTHESEVKETLSLNRIPARDFLTD